LRTSGYLDKAQAMPIEQAIRARIEQLIELGEKLRHSSTFDDEIYDDEELSRLHYEECSGWLAAAHNILNKISVGNEGYMQVAARIFEHNAHNDKATGQAVGQVTQILQHILTDMDAGLLGSVANHARAETFDTFLDHGKAYLANGNSREAGVIVGVVFEDSVRRLCRKINIPENNVQLDQLISALTTAHQLTPIKAKRARAAAAVRTSATHARWEEFTEHDVEAAIRVTEELIVALDG
jgi:hypothetical protein